MNLEQLEKLVGETKYLQHQLESIVEVCGVYEEDNELFISKPFMVLGEISGHNQFSSFTLSDADTLHIIGEMIDKLENDKIILREMGIEINLNPTPFAGE